MTRSPYAAIQVARTFDVPPEWVFGAWIDPAKVRDWLVTPGVGEITRMEIDARVGGKFSFVVKRQGQEQEIEHLGEYLEYVPPRRLVFTWSVPRYSKDSSIVNLDLVTVGHTTELTLTHERVLADYRERVERGWTRILDVIAALIGSSSGGSAVNKLGRVSMKAS